VSGIFGLRIVPQKVDQRHQSTHGISPRTTPGLMGGATHVQDLFGQRQGTLL
jgi:hypothetical protein